MNHPVNFKGANKNAKIHVKRSTTVHSLFFFFNSCTLSLNFVTVSFPIVVTSSCSDTAMLILCSVYSQCNYSYLDQSCP